MQEETRNTIYLAIGLMVAAMTLVACAFVLQVRSNYAETRYEERFARDRAMLNRKYSLYNQNDDLSGAQVIAMIRNFYLDGVDIYIDKDKFGNPYLLDTTTRGLDYTLNANRNKVSISYTTQPDVVNALSWSNDYIYAQAAIAAMFDSTARYSANLVYDGKSVLDAGNIGIQGSNSIITGIRVVRK